MNRIISPQKSEWNKLRQPLEEGEKKFIEWLDRNLHKDWEIYIQPHLNGLCPDVVILNPRVGIGVFEVKNWNFSAMPYYLEEKNNGKFHLISKNSEGKTFTHIPNPVDQLLLYRKEIINLYCYGLNFEKYGTSALTVGLVLPSANKATANELFVPIFENRGRKLCNPFNKEDKHRGYCVITQEDLNTDSILQVLPTGITRFNSKYMNIPIANQLRIWLIEPEADREQRIPINYSDKQKEYISTRTKSGYRRIKGSAGAGKSVVLVGRALRTIEEGKNVLVVNFNITMLNYLQDLAVRQNSKARKSITWLNFHYLCGRLCREAGNDKEYADLFKNLGKNDFPNNDLYCSLVEISIQTLGTQLTKYDVILVDEGQDFSLRWWNILRSLLIKNGEMLLVADSTQDIYEQASLWTDEAMKGAGFRGGWVELEGTYRLPDKLVPLVADFSKRFLPEDMVNIPIKQQTEMSFDTTTLQWFQVESINFNCIKDYCFEMKNQLINLQSLSMSDVTILVQDKAIGKEVCHALDSLNLKYITIFSFKTENEEIIREERARKMAFYKGDKRIKVCTIHSFKGWEAKAILMFIDKAKEIHDYALIYTGLTRLKATENSILNIISSASNLNEYGLTWKTEASEIQ